MTKPGFLHRAADKCSNIPTFCIPSGANMSITTVSSRELNQDVSRAKRAALSGPVFITDRGKPAHVLLSIDAYNRLVGKKRDLVEALSMPGLADIKLDPPRSRELPRAAEFD